MRWTRSVAIALIPLAVTACGDVERPSPPALMLTAQAGNVRLAATLGDASQAKEELGELRILVERYERYGVISSARAERILDAARDVRDALSSLREQSDTNGETDGDEPVDPSPTEGEESIEPAPEDDGEDDEKAEDQEEKEGEKAQEKAEREAEKAEEKAEREAEKDD